MAPLLIATAAAIVLALGSLHLFLTFFSAKFDPRDAGLRDALQQVSPRISRETTMWKAWIGFNASHSLGAMLFGAIYTYLALAHFDLLRSSLVLAVLGAAYLGGMLLLARRYWFSIPFGGVALASVLYTAGLSIGAAP